MKSFFCVICLLACQVWGTAAIAADTVVVIPLGGAKNYMYWQGPWSADTVYKVGDGVQFDGSSYVCVDAHTASLANSPPSTSWDLLAAKGAPGSSALATPIIWSGYCSTDGQTTEAGWLDYCTDSTAFNTAADHLSVDANGTITVLISGYYRINMHALARVASSSRYEAKIMVNGNGEYQINEYGTNFWFPVHMDITLPLTTDDTLSVSCYGNDIVYYGGDLYGGLQVTYQGPLAP